VRLDKFLKVSRLIKRRTLANEACDSERVKLNGRVAKAGAEVKTGDMIEIRFGANTSKIEVLSIAEQASKQGSREMYRLAD
jgi:ribosomal 50S subunit-recycling heat shock protein